jgi:hypothetical protein
MFLHEREAVAPRECAQFVVRIAGTGGLANGVVENQQFTGLRA